MRKYFGSCELIFTTKFTTIDIIYFNIRALSTVTA